MEAREVQQARHRHGGEHPAVQRRAADRFSGGGLRSERIKPDQKDQALADQDAAEEDQTIDEVSAQPAGEPAGWGGEREPHALRASHLNSRAASNSPTTVYAARSSRWSGQPSANVPSASAGRTS